MRYSKIKTKLKGGKKEWEIKVVRIHLAQKGQIDPIQNQGQNLNKFWQEGSKGPLCLI